MKLITYCTTLHALGTDGASVKNKAILKCLSRNNSVRLLVFTYDDLNKNEKAKIDSLVNELNIYECKIHRSRDMMYFSQLDAILKLKPIFTARYQLSLKTKQSVSEDFRNSDLVFIDSVQLSGLLKLATTTKVIISITDAPAITYHEALTQASGLKKLYLFSQLILIGSLEKLIIEKADCVHVVSNYDRRYLTYKYKKHNIVAIPHHVSLGSEYIRSDIGKKNTIRILIVSQCKNANARNSLKSFFRRTYPHISHLSERYELTLLTGVPASFLYDCEIPPDARILEWVEDYVGLVAEHDIHLVLDNFKAGIKTRTLIALSLGKALVTSREGVYGLGVENNRHCLIRTQGEDYAAAIVKLLLTEPYRLELGKSALEFYTRCISSTVHDNRWLTLSKELGC